MNRHFHGINVSLSIQIHCHKMRFCWLPFEEFPHMLTLKFSNPTRGKSRWRIARSNLVKLHSWKNCGGTPRSCADRRHGRPGQISHFRSILDEQTIVQPAKIADSCVFLA
jgi:hypothetical protein